MSADGSVDLAFGGDKRHFRLDIDNLIALQEKVNAGPMQLVGWMQLGVWRVEHITETLRIGLLGGGMEHKAAADLVAQCVRPGNITPHVLTALAVLLSALQGDPDDPVGKTKAARKSRRRNASPPPPSTGPAS